MTSTPGLGSVPLSRRLTFRIVAILSVVMCLALAAIGATLLLSWQLEGSGAAINDAGSLRMRSYRLAFELESYRQGHLPRAVITGHIDEFDHILATLQRGDRNRPLAVPNEIGIRNQLVGVSLYWRDQVRPELLRALDISGGAGSPFSQEHGTRLASLVGQIDRFVMQLEIDNARKTEWLRLCQVALGLMAIAMTCAVIYLLFLIVIRPLEQLSSAMRRLTVGDYAAKVAIESDDEFGEVARGFNRMASSLAGAHATLEARVAEKTASLERRNRELSAMYEMAALLNRASTVDEMTEGFLHRVIEVAGADGGIVRLVDPAHDVMHMAAHRGVSSGMTQRERCIHVNYCLCGDGARGVTRIEALDGSVPIASGCHDEGYNVVSVFPIGSGEPSLGVFNLFFRRAHIFTRQDIQLFEVLGQRLAVAIENLRLSTKARELAVLEERNLFAQGLHDSIAQGLSYLNLQAQMLEVAINDRDDESTHEALTAIRAGVQESYEDVRELLNNFRARLGAEDLGDAIGNLLDKFRRQTGVAVVFHREGFGAPLSPDQQLQLLFIVQEALSNIRKHSQATHVEVRLEDEARLMLSIHDDGVGFDPAILDSSPENHYGLNIMRERAHRAGMELAIRPEPGRGTRRELKLAEENRQVA